MCVRYSGVPALLDAVNLDGNWMVFERDDRSEVLDPGRAVWR